MNQEKSEPVVPIVCFHPRSSINGIRRVVYNMGDYTPINDLTAHPRAWTEKECKALLKPNVINFIVHTEGQFPSTYNYIIGVQIYSSLDEPRHESYLLAYHENLDPQTASCWLQITMLSHIDITVVISLNILSDSLRQGMQDALRDMVATVRGRKIFNFIEKATREQYIAAVKDDAKMEAATAKYVNRVNQAIKTGYINVIFEHSGFQINPSRSPINVPGTDIDVIHVTHTVLSAITSQVIEQLRQKVD